MTLGSTIRDAREAVHLSLPALADATSIRLGLLNEMENNTFIHCGGDTYARGHLKNIAVKIGIDPQILIDLYDQEHSSEHRALKDMLIENSVMQIPQEPKKISWKVPVGISLSILVTFFVVQIVNSNQSSSPVPVPTPTAVVAKASPESSASPSITATKNGGPVSLTLTAARGNSYIDIVVDGKHVSKGSIFQGEMKSFKGDTSISIYLSNPAGLDLTLNGKLLAPLGGQNEEVRRTFR